MELLTIEHKDFCLFIECQGFDGIFGKAKRNIGEEGLFSTYSWTDGVKSVSKYVSEEKLEIKQGEQAPAIFFDNTDYSIWADFNDNVVEAQFGSMLKSENEKFSFHKNVLAGYLNYGNEIGRSEINLIYNVGQETRKFTFSYDVLSTKLNYHEHWKSIIEDIEREYRLLSLDYMRRTFHGFGTDPKGETPELIWWSVFAEEQKKFIKAYKSIIDRPRHRLHGQITYKRADQLTFVPVAVENELSENRKNSAYLYRIQEKVQTNDTQENRFLKFALAQITGKYERLKKRIDELNNLSESAKADIQKTFDELKHLTRNPFFRTIGRYKGMNQESLVLQKATGYSQVYRTWNLLRRGYSLNDGIYRLQTKDIATLYEIWCFIEVSHIVKEQMHLTESDVDNRNRTEMNGLFAWELGQGDYSRILFSKDGEELAELIYNPKKTDKENESISLSDLTVLTVPQKPDIVLRLTKNDLHEGMKMTYLFDAKYRIDGRTDKGVDTPPNDAINQMHRYRDAIYYKDYPSNALKKEVIGGYILFPGDGEPADVAMANFYESIARVNIGAFPLRPKDEQNRKLLETFISQKIEAKGYETIEKVIPQKGAFVEVGNRVLVGVVKSSNPQFNDFLEAKATLYYSGGKFPTTIALSNLHFFVPYIPGQGIRDVYEITKVRTITSSETKGKEDKAQESDIRIGFELNFSHKLYPDYQMIETNRLAGHTFLDTSFDELPQLLKG